MTHTNARVLPQQYISKRNGSLFSQRDTACTSCALYSRRQWQGRRQPWGISTVRSWVQSLSRNSLGCKKLSQSNSSTHKVGLLLEFTSHVPQNTRLILLFTVGEGLDSSHGCMMVYHSIQLDVEQGEPSTSFRFRACLDHFRFTFFLDCKDSQKHIILRNSEYQLFCSCAIWGTCQVLCQSTYTQRTMATCHGLTGWHDHALERQAHWSLKLSEPANLPSPSWRPIHFIKVSSAESVFLTFEAHSMYVPEL